MALFSASGWRHVAPPQFLAPLGASAVAANRRQKMGASWCHSGIWCQSAPAQTWRQVTPNKNLEYPEGAVARASIRMPTACRPGARSSSAFSCCGASVWMGGWCRLVAVGAASGRRGGAMCPVWRLSPQPTHATHTQVPLLQQPPAPTGCPHRVPCTSSTRAAAGAVHGAVPGASTASGTAHDKRWVLRLGPQRLLLAGRGACPTQSEWRGWQKGCARLPLCQPLPGRSTAHLCSVACACMLGSVHVLASRMASCSSAAPSGAQGQPVLCPTLPADALGPGLCR